MPEDKKKDEEKKAGNSGDGAGSEETLLAGKFKSQEELVAGYENLQKAFHTKSTEASKWKTNVEDLLSTQTVPDKEELANQAEEFTERFLANPEPVLNQFALSVRESVLKDVNEYMSARDVMTKFLDNNAELKSNPKLFALNLAETDPKMSISERLDSAKVAFESEIEGLRKTANEKERKRKEFEKKNKAGAVDTGEGAGRDMPSKDDEKSDDDSDPDSFATYIAERKKERARISSLL